MSVMNCSLCYISCRLLLLFEIEGTSNRQQCMVSPTEEYTKHFFSPLPQKIVSGLRDNTIKIWDRTSLQCYKVRGVRRTFLSIFRSKWVSFTYFVWIKNLNHFKLIHHM